MSKSVYSIVLTDEVVAKIDRMAYSLSTSRSNMINRILAEYVSYTTPEQQMREVFSRVEDMLTGADTFKILLQPSDSMMSLRSALSYKYNPTIRYSVELYPAGEETIGELRVSLRSQNSALLLCLDSFFRVWVKTEARCGIHPSFSIERGKYTRKLILPTSRISPHEQGEMIAEYIRTLDTAMKLYFANISNPEAAALEVERVYLKYIKK